MISIGLGLTPGPVPGRPRSCSLTFRHLLQQLEDGALLDERLRLEEVEGGGELSSRHLLLLQLVEVRVQLLLGLRQNPAAARLSGRLLPHQQVPLSRVGHPVDRSDKPQEGQVHDHGPAE